MKRIAIALALVATLGGCGIFRGSGGHGHHRRHSATAVLGDRMPVLASETGAEVDPAIADVPVQVPVPVTNADWPQPGGAPGHSMGALALGQTLSRAWEATIPGTNYRRRLAASPVVANGKLYVMDTEGTLHAFNAQTGASLWTAHLTEHGRNARLSVYGGGASVDSGKVYASNGLGDVAAFDADSGHQLWKVHPSGPLRGAPTIFNGQLYVVTHDNQIIALKQEDGSVVWTEAATVELAGVFGNGAPAAAQGTVVAGFSSGELNAYRYENGRSVWQDALSRSTMATQVADLSDIDALPVIDSGRVYAIGQGGRMVALELITGQRLWELNIAGTATPWIAGEWIFVVSDESKLFCISRANGRVRWMTQLPRWKNAEKRKNPIAWIGPVLAGGRLILASTDGHFANVSVTDGSVIANGNIGGQVLLEPIVANEMLYVLDNKGHLTAWH